jgi:hypothetical protein
MGLASLALRKKLNTTAPERLWFESTNARASITFAGTRDYAHTKRGAYMWESDAQTAGNRAAKNESHP